MYPHRIRLRGPWEATPLTCSSAAPLPKPLRMTMPCRWGDAGLAGFAGRVRLLRRFGYPGRVDETERVWLTFAGVEGEAVAFLNGQGLGPCSGGSEVEIKALLRERNELVVEVEAASDRGGLWGEVALEIRRTAWLKAVAAHVREGAGAWPIEVRGLVLGTAERPLELYAVVNRGTAAYGRVEASPSGQPFLLQGTVEGAAEPPRTCRVELVDGGVVWYGLETPLATEP